MTELLKYTAYLIFCALVAVVLILFLKCVIYSKFIGLSAINPRRLPATSKNEANKSPILKYSEMPNSKIKNRSSYSKQEETAVKPQKKTPKKQKASSLGKKEEKSLIEQSTVPHQKQEKALRREQTEKMPSDEQKSEQIPQINVKQLPEFIVPEDPKRLEDFGVTFQNDELKSIATGKKFALRLTQRQYELLGDFVLLWIQKEMKNRYNFQVSV
jgi:flagellar biosynthesis GTPase FlhF